MEHEQKRHEKHEEARKEGKRLFLRDLKRIRARAEELIA